MRADERHKFARGLGNRTICKKNGADRNTNKNKTESLQQNVIQCPHMPTHIGVNRARSEALCGGPSELGEKKEMKGQGVTGVS